MSEKKPKPKKAPKEKDIVFVECVHFWLKVFHPGWTFGAMHGKKMQSIINKVKFVCVNTPNLHVTEETIIASFKKMCMNLPEWFRDKDLAIIDSKFNEIYTQIQQGKANAKSTYQNRPTSSRIFGEF